MIIIFGLVKNSDKGMEGLMSIFVHFLLITRLIISILIKAVLTNIPQIFLIIGY